MITCDENLSVMDVVSTKMTYTIATNVYILHRVLLEVILLLITTIICYHYAKRRSKQKTIEAITL